MTTTLKRVRAAVIKAVPEIVELKFGCELFIQNYMASVNLLEDRRGRCWIPENGEPNSDFLALGGSLTYFDEKHIKEIIGRDITLADVLRAIGDKYGYGRYTVDETGNIWEMEGWERWLPEEHLIEWNLALPLHLQSEEALTFLDKTLNHD